MDTDQINLLVESRINQVQAEQDALIECWSPYINAVDRYLKDNQNRTMSIYERRTVAQCLENALRDTGFKSKQKLFEATTEDNISFLGIQLPVIAALLPSLVLNDIAIIQALDRRIGAVFYLDVLYGSTKGAITSGDTMLSSTTGHDRTVSGRRYASTMVKDEAIASSSSGSSGATLTGNLTYIPGVDVTNKTITIRDGNGDDVGNDSVTAGTIAGTHNGTVTAAGAYSITLGANVDTNGLTIDYEYQYDKPYNSTTGDYFGVPECDINVTQSSLTAKDFPLRSRYSIGAAMDLQKAHGISKLVPSYGNICRKAA